MLEFQVELLLWVRCWRQKGIDIGRSKLLTLFVTSQPGRMVGARWALKRAFTHKEAIHQMCLFWLSYGWMSTELTSDFTLGTKQNLNSSSWHIWHTNNCQKWIKNEKVTATQSKERGVKKLEKQTIGYKTKLELLLLAHLTH